jgi:hypothetical protein
MSLIMTTKWPVSTTIRAKDPPFGTPHSPCLTEGGHFAAPKNAPVIVRGKSRSSGKKPPCSDAADS